MEINFHKVPLKKRFPLAISRGVKGDSYNLFLSYKKEGFTGWGEGAPGKSERATTVEEIQNQLTILIETGIAALSPEKLNLRAKEMNLSLIHI